MTAAPAAARGRRAVARAASSTTSAFTLHRGEVLGHHRPARRRPHRAGADAVRHDAAPRRGAIRLEGRQLALRSNRDAIRAGIAYVSEDRLIARPRTARSRSATTSSLAVLERLAGALRPDRRRPAPARWPRTGSSGSRIKIPGLDQPVQHALRRQPAARRAGASGWPPRPKVLILDLPTVGVDIGNKHGIYEVVARAGRARRRRHPDLRRGAGGLRHLRPRAAHARRPDRRRRACRAQSPSTRWRTQVYA